MMVSDAEVEWYEVENLRMPESEEDLFTLERYQQFERHLPPIADVVLDVGCSTGRGGAEIARVRPAIELWGLDVVQSRLDALPDCYAKGIRGLTTEIPLEDQSVDVILA